MGSDQFKELLDLVKTKSEENEKLSSQNTELKSQIDKIQDELKQIHGEMSHTKAKLTSLEHDSFKNQIKFGCEMDSKLEEDH